MLIVIVPSGSAQIDVKKILDGVSGSTQKVGCPAIVAPKVHLPTSDSGTRNGPADPWHCGHFSTSQFPYRCSIMPAITPSTSTRSTGGTLILKTDSEQNRNWIMAGISLQSTPLLACTLAFVWPLTLIARQVRNQTQTHTIVGFSVSTAKIRSKLPLTFHLVFLNQPDDPDVMVCPSTTMVSTLTR
ncbi:hypothetical protein BDN71DRAFT_1438900 [Pleurotus eryngii]|uniref:Uncharacterized protein n=1 Tax=Pleurotus eryngii TaxID=5323 RepID=A0A9P6DDZ3_PLEER|nr:hypothetical protein BDN71DRAFT_1438900 [Pleurotus eryngii]